jgi:sialic acid synthase SpsE
MTPDEMRALVQGIRELEANPAKREEYLEKEIVKAGMGSGAKVLQEDEAVFRPYFRKSLMAGQDIPAGTAITAEMLYAMRPQAYAGGLSSEEYEKVLGKVTKVSLKKYDPITRETLT